MIWIDSNFLIMVFLIVIKRKGFCFRFRIQLKGNKIKIYFSCNVDIVLVIVYQCCWILENIIQWSLSNIELIIIRLLLIIFNWELNISLINIWSLKSRLKIWGINRFVCFIRIIIGNWLWVFQIDLLINRLFLFN